MKECSFWYESIRQEDSHLAFEKFSLPFDEELVKVWRIEMVQKVCLRRYLMKYAALEFIMATAKSVWLCFEGEEVKHFLSQLLKARTKLLQEHGQKLKLNRVPLVNEDWYA